MMRRRAGLLAAVVVAVTAPLAAGQEGHRHGHGQDEGQDIHYSFEAVERAESYDVEGLPRQGSRKPPKGLTLPIKVESMTLRQQFNPFGVVRSSLDEGYIGHSGLDIGSSLGSPLYAVADGVILSIEPEQDQHPGMTLKLLLTRGSEPGSGWGFIYEHINVASGKAANTRVRRGERLGTSPLKPSFGHHLELAYFIEGYQWFKHQTCWVDQLEPAEREAFLSRFAQDAARIAEHWGSVGFEGERPFEGLLNSHRFPDGIQLCYPAGTDVRGFR